MVINPESTNEKMLSNFMLISIFIDEWNIFSVTMLSIFLSSYFHFTTIDTGLIIGATTGGAAIGSLIGGILTDKFGRKRIFFLNMSIFIIASILSIFSPTIIFFIIARFITGLPTGSDISNTYSYIMELFKPGKREVIGTKNTLMASYAILGINITIIMLLLLHVAYHLIWTMTLGFPVLPAIMLIIYSKKLEESKLWEDYSEKEHAYTGFIKSLKKDRVKWHTTVYAWVCGIASGIEIGTFAFFIPYIISLLHLSGIVYSRLIIILVYSIGIPAGYLGPKLIPRLGLKRISYSGFSMSFIALIFSGLFLVMKLFIFVPVFMLLFVWGNHWNNQPIITSQAVVSNTDYRGKATGFTNFILQLPAFLSITIFPVLFSIIGIGYSTIVISMASLSGIIISKTVFKEIYGYSGDIRSETVNVQH